ncbi:MAG: succinate dehydrogenase [Ectothiorhodospiraceae bacterium AqS1]|nr:succinate dehydrogenase [Ectothiorhodospiraceae bacterium AqS1]
MSESTLFVLQRISAKLLAPLVLVHLLVALYATYGGLSAAEILARTQGSVLWGGFYLLFVICVAVHVPIGLRNVVREWTGWGGRGLDLASIAWGLVLLGLGLRAVVAITVPGS